MTPQQAYAEAARLMDHMHVHLAMNPDYPAMTAPDCCPSCGEPDLVETGTPIVETSGSGPNYEFGQTEHWWSGWLKCPRCGSETPWADSSL